MGKNTNKSKKAMRKKNSVHDFEIEQDENFCFIAGYTSGGFPYGTTWEAADMDSDDIEDVFI